MLKINPQKYQEYLSIKSDPALALMRMIKDHEKEMEEYMAECDKKMEVMMEEKMAKMEQKEPMHANFIQKIVNQAVAQIIGNSKGEKGDSIKGDNGYTPIKGKDYFDGYTPIKGKDYFDGITPIAGIDYPIREQIWQEIKKRITDIKIPQPQDGKIPIKGIDYFTPKEIQDFLKTLLEKIDMENISKKLETILKEIANLKKEKQQLGGQRTLHRGGIDLRWNENVGTGNGSTTAFDLDFTPYSSSELQVWIGGGIQFLTDDFTLSGKTITFITRPPDGAVIRATYRRT